MAGRNKDPAKLFNLSIPEQWDQWQEAFERKAASANLLDIVDGKAEPLRKPTEPDIEPYRHPSADRKNKPSRPTTVADLGDRDREVFMAARRLYEFQYRLYMDENAQINMVKEWMENSVADHIRSAYFKPREPISTWYSNLKDKCNNEATKRGIQDIYRTKYEKALEPPAPGADMYSWISNWEEAMTTARVKGIYLAQHASFWFPQLHTALCGTFLAEELKRYGILRRRNGVSLDFVNVAAHLRDRVRFYDNVLDNSSGFGHVARLRLRDGEIWSAWEIVQAELPGKSEPCEFTGRRKMQSMSTGVTTCRG